MEEFMSLDNDTINLAINKKFTDFSEKIKSELKSKLVNNEVIQKYTNEFDNIQQMKSAFAKITQANSED